MKYPNRRIVIEAMLDAAADAGDNCTSDHPTDIAHAMSFAIEAAAPAIHSFWQRSQPANPNNPPDEMGG